MTDLSFYKHYTENGRLIMEQVTPNDLQELLGSIFQIAPDLTALDDQPHPDCWSDDFRNLQPEGWQDD